MGNSYVTIQHDSFQNKTTAESYSLEYTLRPRTLALTEKAYFNLRHVSCEPDVDALLIDVHFKSTATNPNIQLDDPGSVILDGMKTYPGEWAFLRNGKLIIQIDGKENIHLTPHESDSDVTTNALTNGSACEELVWYEIDKDILSRICNAKSVRMQLSGSKGSWILDGHDVIFLAKAFWNGFYDSSMYKEEIQHSESVSDQRDAIKKKGCLIEIASFIIGLIIASLTKDCKGNDFVYIGLPVIFIFFIPAIVAAIRKIKASEIQ